MFELVISMMLLVSLASFYHTRIQLMNELSVADIYVANLLTSGRDNDVSQQTEKTYFVGARKGTDYQVKFVYKCALFESA